MKTTIEIPAELFRRTKATEALRGESLKDFLNQAIRDRLERHGAAASASSGWRSVFGQAHQEAVDEVDAVVAAETEGIDPDEWR